MGVGRDDFRPSGVFLGIVALFVTGGVLAWFDIGHAGINVFIFVLAGWLVSLSLHEYGHAILAYHSGDVGVAQRGYLTLNPLKYTHVLLSIVLPLIFVVLGGIGLPGGAVWVDRHAIRNKMADSLISAAGPAANFILTLVLMVPFWLGLPTMEHAVFWAGLAFLALLQLMATLLNLLPIPGVDGGGIIQPWLPYQWRRGFDMVAPYGMLILFGLLWQPQINQYFFGAVYFVADLLGLDVPLAGSGHRLMQFWRSPG